MSSWKTGYPECSPLLRPRPRTIRDWTIRDSAITRFSCSKPTAYRVHARSWSISLLFNGKVMLCLMMSSRFFDTLTFLYQIPSCGTMTSKTSSHTRRPSNPFSASRLAPYARISHELLGQQNTCYCASKGVPKR